MQAAFQTSSAGGGPLFGSLDHIQGDDLLVSISALPCRPGETFAFRLELTERGAWVSGRAQLCSGLRIHSGTSASVQCRIVSLASDEDDRRLRYWLEELEQGGTSAHPDRWLTTLSSSLPSRSREALSKALREHVRARRQREAATS